MKRKRLEEIKNRWSNLKDKTEKMFKEEKEIKSQIKY